VLLRNDPDDQDQLVLVATRDIASGSDPTSSAPVTERRTDLGWDTFTYDTPVVGTAVSGATALPPHLSALLGEPRSWLAVPIVVRQELAGMIVVGSATTDTYADVHIEIAAALAEQGAVAYENAKLFSRVRALAITDELTGLMTRRRFWELAEQQRAGATRHGRPLAAIVLDIDHFKTVNDTYGHAVGDTVLRDVAARLRAQTRDSDILGRVGGEEFALILPETSDAAQTAERLRATVASTAIQTDRGPVDTSISVGVAYLRPDDDLANLLDRADAALYRSKAGGRNQVTIA
jgi:diguanylate cyclase (GGDEF)-like protein